MRRAEAYYAFISAPVSFSGGLEHMDAVGLDQLILTNHHPGPVDGVTLYSAVQANNGTLTIHLSC